MYLSQYTVCINIYPYISVYIHTHILTNMHLCNYNYTSHVTHLTYINIELKQFALLFLHRCRRGPQWGSSRMWLTLDCATTAPCKERVLLSVFVCRWSIFLEHFQSYQQLIFNTSVNDYNVCVSHSFVCSAIKQRQWKKHWVGNWFSCLKLGGAPEPRLLYAPPQL